MQLLCEDFLHEYFNENSKQILDQLLSSSESFSSELKEVATSSDGPKGSNEDVFELFTSAKINIKNEHKKAALRLKKGRTNA